MEYLIKGFFLKFSRTQIKALANGFNIYSNIFSILLNAVGRLLNDVETVGWANGFNISFNKT